MSGWKKARSLSRLCRTNADGGIQACACVGGKHPNEEISVKLRSEGAIVLRRD